jgi:glycosyltransferase involved in cell wall biosynthesis
VSLEFVIPYYGRPDYLRETVTSLLGQTDPRWIALVIDDCYPDPDAAAWVRDLADPRISLVRNKENLGVARTFAKALESARGDYVVLLGCDDRLLPAYVGRMRTLLETTRPSVAQPGVRVIGPTGETARTRTDRVKSHLRPALTEPTLLQGEDLVAGLMRGNWTYFPSLCWDRRLACEIGFGQYDVVLDLAMLIDLLAAGGTIAVDPAVTFEYRRHAASASGTATLTGQRFAEERDFFRSAARKLGSQGWHRAARAARWHPTSRAHAISLIPSAARSRDLSAIGRLTHHALAR